MIASRRSVGWAGVGLALCTAVSAGLSGPARAADDKPEKRTLEERLAQSLRESLSAGADIYNGPRGDPNLGGGDPKGCVEFFRGALRSFRPLLADHPELQKSIDKGLTDAAKLASSRDQAWLLREVLLDVRAGLRGKMPPIIDIVPPPVDGKTLWERLGGEKGVTQIVSDVVDWSIADPDVNFLRDGKYGKTKDEIATLKRHVVALISTIGKGPLPPYTRSMAGVHRGMKITDKEFDAFKSHLTKALLRNEVKEQDQEYLLRIVEATRKSIVSTGADPAIPLATVWDRLGGEKGVTKIVDDWIDPAIADPKVNFFRDGKFKKSRAEIAEMKKQFVALASAVGDGPIKYEGRRMAEIHAKMNITDAEFDAALGHLRRALVGNKVPAEDVETLMKAVEATRKIIVGGKVAAPVPVPEARRAGPDRGDEKRTDDPTRQLLAELIQMSIDRCFPR
jgi:hemoglobin